jgi:hypothetical protein
MNQTFDEVDTAGLTAQGGSESASHSGGRQRRSSEGTNARVAP